MVHKELDEYASLHSASLEECLRITKDYLIAATSKDCSLIVCFRQTKEEMPKFQGYYYWFKLLVSSAAYDMNMFSSSSIDIDLGLALGCSYADAFKSYCKQSFRICFVNIKCHVNCTIINKNSDSYKMNSHFRGQSIPIIEICEQTHSTLLIFCLRVATLSILKDSILFIITKMLFYLKKLFSQHLLHDIELRSQRPT